MLLVTLPLLADSKYNWRSKLKEVSLEKRNVCPELHRLKNKIVFLTFFFNFENSTKTTKINGNIHLLFKLITLGFNH